MADRESLRRAPASRAAASAESATSRERRPSSRPLSAVDWAPWLVFALAALVRIVVVMQLRDSPFFFHPVIDEKTYDDWARGLLHGGWAPKMMFWQPPLYAYWLALVYKVTGGGYVAARMSGALLGALGCAFTFELGCRR